MTNGTAAPARPASDKAAAYWVNLRNDMIDLLAEAAAMIGNDPADVEATRAEVTNADGLTAARASREIDAMKTTIADLRRQVRATKAAAAREAGTATDTVILEADRLYEVDGTIYRTAQAKSSGNLYAKILDTTDGTWDYAPGAIRDIRPEHRMSVERAKELSIRFARCIRCQKELSAEVSVERGIGPVCIKKI